MTRIQSGDFIQKWYPILKEDKTEAFALCFLEKDMLG